MGLILSILGGLVSIGLAVWYYVSKENEKKKKYQEKLDLANEFFEKYLSIFLEGIDSWDNLTSFKSGYFSNYDLKCWLEKYSNLPAKTKNVSLNLKEIPKENTKAVQKLYTILPKAEELRNDYNNRFIEYELSNYADFFDNIEGRKLDVQQRRAIVVNEDNNLVIAGAGTGKTTTLAGKVAYLIERYKIDPEEILLISFTNKACEEMRERIKKKMNINIDVKTFHKLGIDIIADVKDEKPSVFSLSKKELDSIFNGFIETLLENEQYAKLLTGYFQNYLKPFKEDDQFKSDGERMQYLKDMNLFGYKRIALENGKDYREKLKSQEEVMIANFLFLSDIEYTYEESYEFRTASKLFGQYKPDFKIKEYQNKNNKGIYIEHFGIDEFGNVPAWFKGDENISAKDKYANGIKWKRETHAESGTTIIETYSYENKNGTLISGLKQKLLSNGIKIGEKTPSEIWKVIEKNASEDIVGFVTLVQTFLSVLKSNNHNIDEVVILAKNLQNKFERDRALAFLEIFKPILNQYENLLKKKSEIDFADMINSSSNLIASGKWNRKYKYILIDEFQDISIGRYKLIKNILLQNPSAKLFCVGDDWQSIYRFSGSDISIFTEFSRYFGRTSISYIEKTYRFGENLIQLSSNFILKNPKQLVKGLKSNKKDGTLPYEVIYHTSYGNELAGIVQKALDSITKELESSIESVKILLLGRYNHEINILKESDLFEVNRDKADEKTRVKYSKDSRLNIEFMSVHAAKGLEADFVILMNGNSGKYGFPSQISDDPLLNLVLTEADQYANGEERRLFYVAITRTRNKVYILCNSDYPSSFILELEAKNDEGTKVKCDWCETGNLILREGPYSMFYGCSNYPHFCNFTKKITGKEIFELGEKERNSEHYENAIEYYKKAIRQRNYPKELHYHYGNTLYYLKRYHESIVEFKQSIELNISIVNCNYFIGLAHYMLDNYTECLIYLEKASQADKGIKAIFFFMGRAYFKLGNFERAIENFSTHLGFYPKNTDTLLLRGKARLNYGDKHGAWKDWSMADELGSAMAKNLKKNFNLEIEPKRPKLNKLVPTNEIKKEIESAIKNEYLIKFKYQRSTAFNDGQFSYRTIKPIGFEEVGNTKSLCVKGYCYLRKENRTFAIERVSDLIVDPDKIEFSE